MRLLLKLGCGFVLLVVLAVGLAFIFIDPIVKGAIEKGGTYATGVPTTLQSVNAGLVSGSLRLDGLVIENPAGFRKEPFLRLGTLRSSWENRSLVSDEIHVDEIEIADVDLLLESAGGKTNYGRILDHLGKVSGPDEGAGGAAPKPSGSQRTLVVKRVVIRNIKATAVVGDLGNIAGPLSVTVPKIEIHDFRSDGSTVEIVAQLVSAVVQAILESTLSAGKGTLPKELLKDLDKSLKGALDEAQKNLKDLKGIHDTLKDVEKIFK